MLTISATSTEASGTHSPGDALGLAGAERLKVHADVPLHGREQLLGGAVGGVGLFPPVTLVPARDNPLVFTTKHVEVIRLRKSHEKRSEVRRAGMCVRPNGLKVAPNSKSLNLELFIKCVGKHKHLSRPSGGKIGESGFYKLFQRKHSSEAHGNTVTHSPTCIVIFLRAVFVTHS